ncbi:MAG: hypothetical protein WD696_01905 [Bryobacteraceae bacterium]
MTRRTCILTCLLGQPVLAQRSRRRKETREERQARELQELARRADKLRASPETAFLKSRAAELIERARAEEPRSYRYERIQDAIDALLDAGEEIEDSTRPESDHDDDEQEDTARRLERAYFRLQQGDYFVRRANQPDGQSYMQQSRRLYQQARGAYDSRLYDRASRLAEASSEIVSALEHLAQAAVRVPDPPRLK